MRYVLTLFCALTLALPASAQDYQPDTQTPPAATAEIPSPDSPDLQLQATKTREFEDAPIVRLRILDKVRAASRTYELNVDRTVAYANLRIRPRACRKSSPLDDPESAAFLQVWEVKPDGSSAWVFSGWMFASSPSLSAMDHAVYDVTVLECKHPAAETAPDQAGKNTPEDTDAEGEDADADTSSDAANGTGDNDSAASSRD